jgi:glycosyltransferase involved in cell wall biosynthesis
MTPSDEPLVSIIITAREEEEYIEKTLKALRAQTYKNIEIIVTDDCSTDKTVEIARKYADRVESKPCNISEGRNFGAGFASGEFLLFVNADVRLDENWIKNALETYRKYKPSLVFGTFEPMEKTGKSKVFSTICMNIVRDSYRFGFLRTMGECNFFLKKSIFEEVGGYDKRRSCFEDLDLGDRLRKYGRVILEERCRSYASFRRYESDSFYWPLWGIVQEMRLKLTGTTPTVYPLVRKK